MAEYTIRLGDLINAGYDVEQKAMQNWPSPTPEWRQEVNDAIIRHYWFKEIGFETADMFCWYLDTALREIMPYYNERRAVDLMDIGQDPLTTFYTTSTTTDSRTSERSTDSKTVDERHNGRTSTDDFTTTNNVSASGTNDGTTNTTDNSTTNNTDDSYTKNYDIPTTGGSSGNGPGGFSDDYATSGNVSNDAASSTVNGTTNTVNKATTSSKSDSTGTNKGTRTEKANENGTSTTAGKDTSTDGGTSTTTTSGSNTAKFELLAKYREIIENIIPMILKERSISSCFMGVLGGYAGEY